MKYMLIIVILLTSLSYSYARIDTIYKHVNEIKAITNYKSNNIACVSSYQKFNEQNQPYELGENIIYSRNSGVTWDTLRGWWLPMWHFDSNAVAPWDELCFMFYFDADILCMMHTDGKFLRYDLNTKKCDTFNLISKDVMDGEVATYSQFDENSAIISQTYNDSVHITYDKGKSWKSIYRPGEFREVPSHSRFRPGGHAIIDKKYNFFTFYQIAIIQYVSSPFGHPIGGYADGCFNLTSCRYDSEYDSLIWGYVGKEYSLSYPQFINDSVAFAPGHKVYYFSDSLLADSAFKKPVVYKTENKGKTWEKVYEAEYFIGKNSTRVFIFGDTILFPFGSSKGFGCIRSYDLGKTWEVKYFLNVLSANDKLIDIDIASPNEYIISSDDDNPIARLQMHYILKYTEYYVSAPEEPKVFLPDAKIFPNPAVDYVNIEFEPWLGLPSSVELYDILGNKVSTQIYRSEGSVMINTVALSAGTYTVRISTPNGVIAKAFVKGL